MATDTRPGYAGVFRYLAENLAKCDKCGYLVASAFAPEKEGEPCPKCGVDWHEEIAVYDEADVVAAFEAGLRVGRGE